VTVAKLIELLQEAVKDDPSIANLPVLSEGCDCYGAASGVQCINKPEWEERALLLKRGDS
jgi:hypothetical protein